MSFFESFYVAAFLIAIVFSVLLCLYLSVKIFSFLVKIFFFLIGKFEKTQKTQNRSIDH